MGNTNSNSQPFSAVEVQDQTHFTLSEVNKLHKEFIKLASKSSEKPDHISREQFFESLRLVDFESSQDKFMERLYTVFDKDNCGYLDFKEFITGLSILCRGSLKERITIAFNLFDLDSNGYVTRDEMAQVMTNMNSTLSKLQKSGHDPKVDIPKQVAKIFEECDKDKDNQLSLREFVQTVQRHPEILDFFQLGIPEDRALDQTIKLVCLDFGHWSNIAFEFALRSTKAQDKIILAYVHPKADMDKRPPLMKPENFLQRHKEEGHERAEFLKKYEQKVVSKSILCDTVFMNGDPKEEILKLLQARPEIDQLVLGIHSRAKSSTPIGHLPTFFVENAPCSVLIVK